MKGYQFRFEKLLKTRQITRDDLAAKVARARKILQIEQRKLADFESRRDMCMDWLATLQLGALDPSEIQRSYAYLQQVREAIDRQTSLIREIHLRAEALRNLLVEAEKEKKTLEKLDEKDRGQFLREYLQKEQAALDEVCINKFAQRNAHHHAPVQQQ